MSDVSAASAAQEGPADEEDPELERLSYASLVGGKPLPDGRCRPPHCPALAAPARFHQPVHHRPSRDQRRTASGGH